MKGAEKSSSGTGSSTREDANSSIFATAIDNKTVSSVESLPDIDESEGTGTSSERKKRRKDQSTKEEDEAAFKALQSKLAVVKPDLQKIMYFM
jgi:hypothetical protein